MTTAAQPKPKPKLNFVVPHADPNMNALLYGPPKSGKTVGASSAPGPVLYLNGDRPNATRFAHGLRGKDMHEVRVESLQTLIDVTEELESGHYRSVAVDPISDIYRVILEDLSGRALSPQIQHYGDTGTHVERFCRHLCELPINVALVAHETSVKDEDSGGFERLPYTGTNNPALGAKLMAMVDVIGYCGVIEGEGDAPPRYVAQLVNGKGRRGGDRFGVLGPMRDIDLGEWIKLAKNPTSKEDSR